MAEYALISAVVIRIFMLCTPFMGLLQRDSRHFALIGIELDEALELMGAVNSRVVLLSWPISSAIAVFSRIGEEKRAILPVPLSFFLLATVSLAIVVLYIPTRMLRGTLPPILVVLTTSTLDLLLFFFGLPQIAALLSRPVEML